MKWSLSLALSLAGPTASPVAPLPPRDPPNAAPARILRPTYVAPIRAADPVTSERDTKARELGLRPVGDGYRYDGEPEERFAAVIARDGSVELIVDPSVVIVADGICLVAVCKLTKTGREVARRRKAARTALTIATVLAEAATGRITLGARRPPYGVPANGPKPQLRRVIQPVPVVTTVGRYGHLPAPNVAMSDFMERTFELRLELAAQAAREDLDAANRQLSQRLATLWSDAALSDAKRRAEILRMWEEIDPSAAEPIEHADPVLGEGLASELEMAIAQAKGEARRKIVESVRRHAPQGTAAGFSQDQLEAFNATRSGAGRFEPYDRGPRAPALTPSPPDPRSPPRDSGPTPSPPVE